MANSASHQHFSNFFLPIPPQVAIGVVTGHPRAGRELPVVPIVLNCTTPPLMTAAAKR